MPAQDSVRVVRFGEYELDLTSSELRKHDHRVPLPDQAIRILAMLLERPGEVITREQITDRLWPSGTVVEFDHGINSSIRRLRAALNDSADRPRYIETLPKRGYRFIFPVEDEKRVLAEPQVEVAEVSPVPEQQREDQSGRRWLWVGIGATALLAVAILAFMQWRTAQPKSINSIAVLPLVNATGDPNAEYLSDGISEEIINTLSAAHHLKVIARTSAFRFKGSKIDPQKAGRQLGVGAILIGTLVRRGDSLVIQTDLVKVSDGSELWGARYNRQISELQTVQAEIAPEIASKLRLRLAGDEEKRLAKRYTDHSEAYELYLKAAHTDSFSEALDLVQRSIAKDPNFALAYVRLANVYLGMSEGRVLASKKGLPKARDAATKALELDDGLGEAHVVLARVLMNLNWDWRGAERELKRGIELNASIGHIFYSSYLLYVGRHQEALTEAQRAEEIDPLSSEIQGRIAMVYDGTRQYDRSIQKARAPGASDFTKFFGALALAEKGNYSESIAVLKGGSFLSPGVQGHIGYAYARAGNRPEAERICRELQRESEKEGVGAYEVAFINAALDKKEEAFKWLDIAYQQHDSGMKFLKVDPCLDPLRSDPRFDELIRRVGLPL